jgi:hypothetical protein
LEAGSETLSVFCLAECPPMEWVLKCRFVRDIFKDSQSMKQAFHWRRVLHVEDDSQRLLGFARPTFVPIASSAPAGRIGIAGEEAIAYPAINKSGVQRGLRLKCEVEGTMMAPAEPMPYLYSSIDVP